MYKPLARLLPRMGDENDGVIIGAILRGHDFFEKGQVYEICKDLFGEIHIRKVGKSHLHPMRDWGREIGYLMESWGKYLYLTEDEYKDAIRKEKIKNEIESG